MLKFVWLTTALIFCLAPCVRADDPIKDKLDKEKAVYDADIKKLKEEVLASLQKKNEAARREGNLKLVDQIKEEQDKFEDNGALPTAVPTTEYQREVRHAFKKLEAAYGQAIKDYLVAKNDGEAESLNKELEDLQKTALQPKARSNQIVWVGLSDKQFRMRVEVDLKEDGTFAGDYFVLREDDSIRAQWRIEGKIAKGQITFRPVKTVVEAAGLFPSLYVGKYTKTRIEGTWQLLDGNAKGPFYMTPEKKTENKK